jgi:hypothetical protein
MSTIARFSLSFKPTNWSCGSIKTYQLTWLRSILLSHYKIVRDRKIIQVKVEIEVVEEQ